MSVGQRTRSRPDLFVAEFITGPPTHTLITGSPPPPSPIRSSSSKHISLEQPLTNINTLPWPRMDGDVCVCVCVCEGARVRGRGVGGGRGWGWGRSVGDVPAAELLNSILMTKAPSGASGDREKGNNSRYWRCWLCHNQGPSALLALEGPRSRES